MLTVNLRPARVNLSGRFFLFPIGGTMEQLTDKATNDRRLERLIKLLEMDIDVCHDYVVEECGMYYDSIVVSSDYIYCKGDTPLCLVAHMDTVCEYIPKLLHLNGNGILSNQKGCLGADDRAGVAAIFEILEKNSQLHGTTRRPSVLFTHGEEVGCKGALKFASSATFELFSEDTHLMLEIDRAGYMEAVAYSQTTDVVIDTIIESSGFKLACGSFSDITVLTEQSGIPSYNLSIGYYHQHTSNEFLSISEYYEMITNIYNLIDTIYESKALDEGRRLVDGIWDTWQSRQWSSSVYGYQLDDEFADLYYKYSNKLKRTYNMLDHLATYGLKKVGERVAVEMLDCISAELGTPSDVEMVISIMLMDITGEEEDDEIW